MSFLFFLFCFIVGGLLFAAYLRSRNLRALYASALFFAAGIITAAAIAVYG